MADLAQVTEHIRGAVGDDSGVVKKRLQELASLEAEIIAKGNPLPRMHS